MVQVNGYTPNLLAVFAEESPELSKTILRQLQKLNCRVRHTYNLAEARAVAVTELPEIVLVTGRSKEFSELARSWRSSQVLNAPFLIYVGETKYEEVEQWADSIVPVHLLTQQLKLHINLRSRIAQLQAADEEFRRENEQLKQELDAHRHVSEQLNLYKTAILHIVTHELRTPMLQVKTAIALLAEDIGEANTLVELATGATTRLEARIHNIALLNDLLNQSFQLNAFEPVALSEVIDSAIRNLRRRWEYKHKVDRIRLNLPAEITPIWGDRQGLVIAIELLIDNALKFSEKDVMVSITQHEASVLIAVKDQGIGIAKQNLQRIYEPFFQVDSSTTRKFAGMGLGLTIAKSILDRHNTTITVQTKIGKGSTFSFRLPTAGLNL
jgi:signal transduction histidine kinase